MKVIKKYFVTQLVGQGVCLEKTMRK